LDLSDVDLLALRLFFEVVSVSPGCGEFANFTQAAQSCFPLHVQVGIEPKDTTDLAAWQDRNITAFITSINKYTTIVSTLGVVTATTRNARLLGVQNWPGDTYLDAKNLFDVLGRTPTQCRETYLNQTIRREIDAKNPTLTPTEPTQSPLAGKTMSPGALPSGNSTIPPTDETGLIVGLIFGLIIIPGLLLFGYWAWRKRNSVSDGSQISTIILWWTGIAFCPAEKWTICRGDINSFVAVSSVVANQLWDCNCNIWRL